MTHVVMYSSGFCPYCSMAKTLLSKKGVVFEERSVDADHTIRNEMLARANGGYTVPQIFIGDHHIGGCDDLFRLERTGELNELLE